MYGLFKPLNNYYLYQSNEKQRNVLIDFVGGCGGISIELVVVHLVNLFLSKIKYVVCLL